METGDVWKACDFLMMLIKARSEAEFRWTSLDMLWIVLQSIPTLKL